MDVYHNQFDFLLCIRLDHEYIELIGPLMCDCFHPQIRLEGSEWSLPFAIEKEGVMDIVVRHASGHRQSVRLDVRGYGDGSRFVVVFQLGSGRGPYRYVAFQFLILYTFV